MNIFAAPSTSGIKVTKPPYALRINNKDRVFTFGPDNKIETEDGTAILPDACIIGIEHFWGHLRDSIETDGGITTNTPKLEDIDILYWIALPSAKNKHGLLPLNTVIATPLVTKAQSSLQAYTAKVENSDRALHGVVTNFKFTSYDTSNHKKIPTLDFFVNETVCKEPKVAEALKAIAVWVATPDAQEQLHEVSTQAWMGTLVRLSSDEKDNKTLKDALRYHITGIAPVSSAALAYADTGEDILTLPSASTLALAEAG
jgi:hypothetical protein